MTGGTPPGKVIIRKKMRVKYTRRSNMTFTSFIRMVQARGDDFVYRQSMFGGELIMGDTKFIFTNPNRKKAMSHLYLFSMVKRDFGKWLKKNKIKRLRENPQSYCSDYKFKKGREIAAADLDNAYWEIAFKYGMISEGTYQKGMLINNKELTLSTLSALGRDKSYNIVRHGEDTGDIKKILGNDQYRKAYSKVRLRCYEYMMQLARLLGTDFLEYKTDCIYFYYSKKNVLAIKKFMQKNGLSFKFSDNVPEELADQD